MTAIGFLLTLFGFTTVGVFKDDDESTNGLVTVGCAAAILGGFMLTIGIAIMLWRHAP